MNACQLNYTITVDAAWLSVSPASGATDGRQTVIVTYDTDELAVGTHTATITISDPLAGNDPQTIAVTMEVTVRSTGVDEKEGRVRKHKYVHARVQPIYP